MVNHFGSLTGGHYTAEIKSYENGQWYSFNDGRVESVREHNLTSPQTVKCLTT